MENHTSDYRVEKDSIGTKDVPANVYYGVQSLRAAENFPITGLRMNPELIRSLAYIKKAAALTNLEAGLLNERIANAIVRACDEILAGKLREQFIVDPVQGGAGTSINMNANEVIANRALELLGHKKGEYEYCHPNNHVNCSQSTNDIYPTALRIALYTMLGQLTGDMAYLQQGFAAKSEEFSDVIKMGRTQLQDAVPMTLGQEFGAYATTIGEDILRVEESRKLLLEVNLGATAIGTSINAPKGYAEVASKALAEVSGIPELRRTTRDEPDYEKLMRWRMDILRQHGLGLRQIQDVIAQIDPLPGAKEFLDELRATTQAVIVSDTFEEFAQPLMKKLGWPTILCNSLEIDRDGMLSGIKMRCEHSKLTTVRALQSIGYETIASGDSYNDLEMILASKAGFLFRSTDKIKADYPQLPAFETYDELLNGIKAAMA